MFYSNNYGNIPVLISFADHAAAAANSLFAAAQKGGTRTFPLNVHQFERAQALRALARGE